MSIPDEKTVDKGTASDPSIEPCPIMLEFRLMPEPFGASM